MTEIKNSNFSDFLARFYNLYDGIIRNVTIKFMSKQHKTTVTVICSVQDQEIVGDDSWINLTFNVINVIDLILLEGNITCVVLSTGINIGFFDEHIYLDFCPFTEEPEGIDDFRKSRFLIVGGACFWQLSSYSE